jgi:hypothetical protein
VLHAAPFRGGAALERLAALIDRTTFPEAQFVGVERAGGWTA